MTIAKWGLTALAVGLGPTGCVPEEKARPAQNQAAESAAAGSEQPGSPVPADGRAVPLPAHDPRHVALRSYRAAVAGWEEAIDAALVRLDASVAKVAVAGRADREAALDEFRKLIPVLRGASRAVLADHQAVLDGTDTLARELRHGPTAFRQAARAWRERAEDYTVATFRENALRYAEEFDRYAALLPGRRAEVQAFADELRDEGPLLRELGSSIDDFARFIDQHPGVGIPDPRPQYVAQMRGYATQLTAFQGLLRRYTAAIRSGSVSSDLQAERGKGKPATPPPPVPTPPPGWSPPSSPSSPLSPPPPPASPVTGSVAAERVSLRRPLDTLPVVHAKSSDMANALPRPGADRGQPRPRTPPIAPPPPLPIVTAPTRPPTNPRPPVVVYRVSAAPWPCPVCAPPRPIVYRVWATTAAAPNHHVVAIRCPGPPVGPPTRPGGGAP